MSELTGTPAGAGSPDGERTFAALPPARGRGFAETWWGVRWLKALEDTALDGAQLRQGRRVARIGAVGAVSVRPGRITAVVRDRDGTPHRADVLLRELGPAEWDRLLEVAAGEAGHIAALLDREMPPRLVEDADSAGVELLPAIGDLDPECDCDAWDHCSHTAALSYQMARLLDQDPFVLLLLRGRAEERLLNELQQRSAALATPDGPRAAPARDDGRSGTGEGAAAGATGPDGVPAEEAYALATLLPPLPALPPAGTWPVSAPSLHGGSAQPHEPDVAALEFLVSDATVRARRLLHAALAPGHADSVPGAELTEWQDAVRLAAAGPEQRIVERLATGCGRTSAQLRTAVRAWELGGADGLSVLEEAWTPGTVALARARDQLAAGWGEEERRPALRVTRNRWTSADGTAQLRYGRDGRWWPYREENGAWWPAGGPEQDPAAALAVVSGTDASDRIGSGSDGPRSRGPRSDGSGRSGRA